MRKSKDNILLPVFVVDPGHHTGWAWVDKAGTILLHGNFKWKTVPEFIAKASPLFQDIEFNTLVIEGQYMGNNFGTVASLFRSKTLWEVVATLSAKKEVNLITITPPQWQSKTLLCGAVDRETMIPYCIHAASKLVGFKIIDHNEATAVCLAQYMIMNLDSK